jgi:DNA-binding transcriptional ArsR family regulator
MLTPSFDPSIIDGGIFLALPFSLDPNPPEIIRCPPLLTCKHFIAYIIAMDLDTVFKALADSTRRRLLDALRSRNGQTLGRLCEDLAMTRQAVTQHLKRLEEANLVATVWRGREKLHYLNPVPLQQIYNRWIEKYERQQLQALSDLKKTAEGD